MSSEPQATQPSACSERSPQTGQPATPADPEVAERADDHVLERAGGAGRRCRGRRDAGGAECAGVPADARRPPSQTLLKTPITLPSTWASVVMIGS